MSKSQPKYFAMDMNRFGQGKHGFRVGRDPTIAGTCWTTESSEANTYDSRQDAFAASQDANPIHPDTRIA